MCTILRVETHVQIKQHFVKESRIHFEPFLGVSTVPIWRGVHPHFNIEAYSCSTPCQDRFFDLVVTSGMYDGGTWDMLNWPTFQRKCAFAIVRAQQMGCNAWV